MKFIEMKKNDQTKPDNILVVENQIRPPNVSGGNSDLFDATVILRIPLQVHIFPLLEKQTSRTMESISITTNVVNALFCQQNVDHNY